MTTEEYSKKGIRKEQLNSLHKNVLQVANKLKQKKKIVDVIILFETCCKELPNPEPAIDQAIRDLYRMRYFIRGRQLFRDDILTNDRRKNIYEYILKYPGAHEREIRKTFQLGAFIARHHLNLLVKFNFLRKRSYQNKAIFFPSDFEETQEEKTILLRNVLNKTIYECIKEHEQLRIAELKDQLQIPYSTAQAHLIRLLDGGLIKKIMKDNMIYYVASNIEIQEETIEVKKELNGFISSEKS
ncbi:MAG: hypothetical protein HWN66_19420 [Candidatus Helarchaeota archaeon]|nr:hypothetical protein [Candidatus Helarchaeota archaeon]